MSASNYYKTQDEWSADCNVSPRMLRNYLTLPGAPKKRKSGWPKKQCQEFVAACKKNGVSGDGSVRDQKALKEIELIEIKIQAADDDLRKARKELVNRKEEEARFTKILEGIAGKVRSWSDHQSAKHPELVEEIEGLRDSLFAGIREVELDD